jgi:hypothetical protein
MGYPNYEGLKEAFYQYVLSDTWLITGWVLAFSVALFFIGNFIASLLIRPINKIANYCEEAMTNPDAEYVPDQIADLKTLTRYSELFFQYISRSRKEKRFLDPMIPTYYAKIRKPVFEKAFLLHFVLIFGIICVISGYVLYSFSIEVFDKMVSLGIDSLKKTDPMASLLAHQQKSMQEILSFNFVILLALYITLAINLYNSVSSAAFGIFATFRAFMKGHYQNRVHVIGHHFIRPDTRMINNFLDHVEKELIHSEKVQEVSKNKISELRKLKS